MKLDWLLCDECGEPGVEPPKGDVVDGHKVGHGPQLCADCIEEQKIRERTDRWRGHYRTDPEAEVRFQRMMRGD